MYYFVYEDFKGGSILGSARNTGAALLKLADYSSFGRPIGVVDLTFKEILTVQEDGSELIEKDISTLIISTGLPDAEYTVRRGVINIEELKGICSMKMEGESKALENKSNFSATSLELIITILSALAICILIHGF